MFGRDAVFRGGTIRDKQEGKKTARTGREMQFDNRSVHRGPGRQPTECGNEGVERINEVFSVPPAQGSQGSGEKWEGGCRKSSLCCWDRQPAGKCIMTREGLAEEPLDAIRSRAKKGRGCSLWVGLRTSRIRKATAKDGLATDGCVWGGVDGTGAKCERNGGIGLTCWGMADLSCRSNR